MKAKIFLLGITFLLMGTLFCLVRANVADTDDLVLIKISGVEQDYIPHIKESSVTVGFLDKQTGIALVREEDLLRYNQLGMVSEILDYVKEEDRYVLVSLRYQDQIEKLEDIGHPLIRKGNRALIKVRRDLDRSGSKYGLELIKIFQVPQKTAVRKMVDVSPSPLTSGLIQQVSSVSIYNFINDLQNFQTRYAYTEKCSLAADWLRDQFESWGLDVTEHWFFNSAWISFPDPQRNIIATLPGTSKPDEIVAICGHYDSFSDAPLSFAPGADDNASGTAAVLETARILSQYESERTLQFICFGGEEQWMIGSYAFVEERRAAGDNYVAVINNDMIAYTGDGEQEDIEVDCIPETEWLADIIVTLASNFVTYPMSKNVDWGNVSDHTPFWENGYPAIELAEDEADEIWGDANPWYHTKGDIIETLNMDFATQIVKMNVMALALIAGVEVTGSVSDDTIGESRGNGNGYVDPGETIELEVTLNNIGDQDVHGVHATLHTEDEFITILTETVAFGDIQAGGSAIGQNAATFIVSEQCSSGHRILFSLDIEDDQATSWESGIIVQVLQPTLIPQSHSIEEIEGDGDNVPDPGETMSLYVLVKNVGLRTASGVTAQLETEDPDITITDNEAVFPDMEVGAVAGNGDDSFTFSISGDAEPRAVRFVMHLSEGQGYYQTDVILRLLIGQGKVLLVADDGAIDNQDYYTEVFTHLGVTFDLLKMEGMAKTVGDMLPDYSEVIWFTGAVENNTLRPEDQSDLQAFLEGGGRLLLSGSMIGYDVGDSPFYKEYLHGRYVSFMTRLHHLNGAPSNPVVGDLDITLSSTGANAQTFAGETDPISPAVSVFNYDQTTEEGPGLVKSSGSGALAVETSVYKVVYFSFGLEGVEPLEDRANVLEDVLLWFKEPGVDKGDADGNGTINIVDAVVAVNFVLGVEQPDENQFVRTDMNYDGQINILDVVAIVNAILG